MLLSAASVLGGLVVLIFASDRLVTSAVRVSAAFGLSPVLIGALVVGLGTSLPELLVSAIAAGNGELDVAMANVVGSNAANVTLVLGAAALLRPLVSQLEVLRKEGVLMLVAVVGLAVVLLDGEVSRTEGFVLLGGMGVALWLLIGWSADHESPVVSTDADALGGGRSPLVEMLIGLVALVATVLGANFLLQGALDIGEELGLTATFLGVMLGVGTSLPELATALAAARRNAPELVVGNVVGSNLFNSLAVAGTAAVIGPATLVDLSSFEVGFMVIAVATAGIFIRTGRLERVEGGVLLVGFLVFAALSF